MRINIHSIGLKLFAISALIILVTASAIAILGYREARHTIIDEAKRHVYSIVLERRARLDSWLIERKQNIETIALAPDLARLFLKESEVNQEDALIYQLSQFSGTLFTAALNRSFTPQLSYGLNSEKISLSDIAIIQGALIGESSFGPVHLNKDNSPVINFACPIMRLDAEIVGALFYQFSTAETINRIMTDSLSLGSSGEVFLVDESMVMLTPSRFHEHPAHLTHKMPIPPVKAALEKNTGSMVYEGFLGDEVVGAYATMPNYGWIIVTEMSTAEALAGLRMIVTNTIGAAIVALIIMLTVALLLARNWTRPIAVVAHTSQQVAAGDYHVRIPEQKRRDEIGTLVRMFNRMVAGLDKQRGELESSHEKLLQSEKLAAIGRLAASIVHEMRSPLSSIKMNLQLLTRDTVQGSNKAKHLELAGREVKRMETMLSELLDYSKPPSLTLVEAMPETLMERAIELIKQDADKLGISVSYRMKEKIPTLIIDEELFLRAIDNLLINALHASKKGATIELILGIPDKNTVGIEIRDTGEGMNQRVLERIFDPFFTTRDDGVGLGMCNVKKIVEAHHGKIEITSEVGAGTIVTVTIPIRGEHGNTAGH